ncbi:MAG: SRPBCC family protein [Myxococcales bacterium]|nr:SRPBCC family protein [Myxococcales bacterium]
MRTTVIRAATAIALFVAASASLVAAAEEYDENAGIFTAQIPEEGSRISWGQAVIVLDKPIDEVLPIVLDYGNYVDFMPNFTKSRVLAQRGTRAMVYMEVSVAKGAITLYGQLNLAERPESGDVRVVEAHLMDGNIDAFSASFTLTPMDGGTRTEIDFKIYVDPDIPLPSSVFSRENERAAGRTVRALRTRVFEGPQRSS